MLHLHLWWHYLITLYIHLNWPSYLCLFNHNLYPSLIWPLLSHIRHQFQFQWNYSAFVALVLLQCLSVTTCHPNLTLIELNCAVLCVPHPWHQAKVMAFWLCRTCPEVQLKHISLHCTISPMQCYISSIWSPMLQGCRCNCCQFSCNCTGVCRKRFHCCAECFNKYGVGFLFSQWIRRFLLFFWWIGRFFILKPNPILQREGVTKAGNVSAKLYQLFSIVNDEG